MEYITLQSHHLNWFFYRLYDCATLLYVRSSAYTYAHLCMFILLFFIFSLVSTRVTHVYARFVHNTHIFVHIPPDLRKFTHNSTRIYHELICLQFFSNIFHSFCTFTPVATHFYHVMTCLRMFPCNFTQFARVYVCLYTFISWIHMFENVSKYLYMQFIRLYMLLYVFSHALTSLHMFPHIFVYFPHVSICFLYIVHIFWCRHALYYTASNFVCTYLCVCICVHVFLCAHI